ncbi:unnamed protein product [Prorocentrum cordatum]|uniref:Cytochrome b561 domain-containing protein n=1 Tax=Prorocentrum cordatum TaxID=2364126 RepID=A0ABN9XGY4_9DINO|nr:unnamed protein product [Polarella glacialis]
MRPSCNLRPGALPSGAGMVSKQMAEEEEGMLHGGREAMLSGLHVMGSHFTGATDEDEELIPGKPVFTGLKFEDEDSQATARRVGYASLALAGLALLHAMLQAAWRHEVMNTTLHLVLGLLLPLVGYRGATLDHGTRWRPRLLWAFHVGNVIFVIVHAVMLATVVMKANGSKCQTCGVMERANTHICNRNGLRRMEIQPLMLCGSSVG